MQWKNVQRYAQWLMMSSWRVFVSDYSISKLVCVICLVLTTPLHIDVMEELCQQNLLDYV